MKPRIGIIGGTGLLGLPVLNELVSSGFEVKALCRNVLKAKLVFPENVNIHEGDLEDKFSLERFFKEIDVLYLNLSVNPSNKETDFLPEREGLENILDVASSLKLKRILFLSSLVKNYQGKNGFDWWIFKLKHNAVKLIKLSGVPYTIFYPSQFMENISILQKSGNKILLAGESKQKANFISAFDYSRMVTRSIELNFSESNEFVIQGLESLTTEEAAKIFVKEYKKENLKISKSPLFVLKFLGLFIPNMKFTAKICEALNNYPEKFQGEEAWKILGKPTLRISDFAKI